MRHVKLFVLPLFLLWVCYYADSWKMSKWPSSVIITVIVFSKKLLEFTVMLVLSQLPYLGCV